jgi:hypothetical protein
MKCEDASMILQRAGSGAELERRAAAEHLLGCEDCRDAARAAAALRSDADKPVPVPASHAFERAIAAAAAREAWIARTAPRRPSFLVGMGVGAALAAGIAVAVFVFRPDAAVAPAGAPAVLLSLNEERDVSVALSSPERLENAEIRIALSGAIGLKGFAERRELHWTTDLDRGVNQLTLPIVALGAGGGQVLVEVEHGDKRRTFVVDVRTTSAGPAAALFAPGAAHLRDVSLEPRVI